jgi:hypothetical protein
MVLLLELEACAVVAGAEQRTASAGHENVARPIPPIRRVADGGVCWSPGGVWRRPARLRSSTVQIKRRCRGVCSRILRIQRSSLTATYYRYFSSFLSNSTSFHVFTDCMSSCIMMTPDFNFPHRLRSCDSVLLPPNKEDIETLTSLTAGPFNSEHIMLVESKGQSVIGIEQVGLSEGLLTNERRGSKQLSHPKLKEYFSIDSPTFQSSVDDQSELSWNSPSLQVVDVENLIPFIFGGRREIEGRHHLDPDEILSLAIPQGRGSPEKMLQQTSRPVPLKNAAITQKTRTCSAA